MKYYFYRTTNLINGKYYQGVHHSKCPEKDPYFGSGPGITAAVKKYGRENFKVDILKYFNSMQEAYEYEASQITLESLDPRICYNQVPGGKGCREGVIHMYRSSEEIRVHESLETYYQSLGYLRGRPEKTRNKLRMVNKGRKSKSRGKMYMYRGYSEEIRILPEEKEMYLEQGFLPGHSEYSRERVRQAALNTVHITDGTVEKRVKVGSEIPEGFRIGRKARTLEHCKNIGEALKGRKDSQETLDKKSKAKKGKHWKVVDGKRTWY